jgi:hypothetical protein
MRQSRFGLYNGAIWGEAGDGFRRAWERRRSCAQLREEGGAGKGGG